MSKDVGIAHTPQVSLGYPKDNHFVNQTNTSQQYHNEIVQPISAPQVATQRCLSVYMCVQHCYALSRDQNHNIFHRQQKKALLSDSDARTTRNSSLAKNFSVKASAEACFELEWLAIYELVEDPAVFQVRVIIVRT